MPVLVVGDVVASRQVPDQRRLLDGLAAAVADLDRAVSAAATTGDEFQAVFEHLPTAITSVAALRLRLMDEPPADEPVELRVGFGLGDVDAAGALDAGAPGQSGAGWWAARAALDHVTATRRGWPVMRWWVDGDEDLAATRAALVALDTVVAGFDAMDVSLARGLLSGMAPTDLADQHGVTRQSVGRRLRDHGVYGWVRSLQVLAGEHGWPSV